MSDLISRQGVLKILTDISYNHCPTAQASEAIDLAKTMIVVLHDAEPERKTGKWNFIGDNMFECTCCGIAYTAQQFDSLKNHINDKRFPRFCPSCGEKMEVDE